MSADRLLAKKYLRTVLAAPDGSHGGAGRFATTYAAPRSPRGEEAVSDALKGPFLALEDGTVWPNPADPREVEWHLRYDRENGTPMDRSTELLAASYVEAFRSFFWSNSKRRAQVVRMLRKKMGFKR